MLQHHETPMVLGDTFWYMFPLALRLSWFLVIVLLHCKNGAPALEHKFRPSASIPLVLRGLSILHVVWIVNLFL